MGLIEIQPKEVEQVVTGSGTYYVKPKNGRLLIHSFPNLVKSNGREVTDEQPAEIDLQSDRDLFVYNPDDSDTVQVVVDPQNFSLTLFPRRVIERPVDKASREPERRQTFTATGQTVLAGTSDTVTFSASQRLVSYSASIAVTNPNGVDLDLISAKVQWITSGDNYEINVNPAYNSQIRPEPNVQLEANDDVKFTIRNDAASDIEVDVSVNNAER